MCGRIKIAVKFAFKLLLIPVISLFTNLAKKQSEEQLRRVGDLLSGLPYWAGIEITGNLQEALIDKSMCRFKEAMAGVIAVRGKQVRKT